MVDRLHGLYQQLHLCLGIYILKLNECCHIGISMRLDFGVNQPPHSSSKTEIIIGDTVCSLRVCRNIRLAECLCFQVAEIDILFGLVW